MVRPSLSRRISPAGLGLALFWAAFISCGAPSTSPAAPEGIRETETWYGGYLGGQRIGYLRKLISKTPSGGMRIYVENFVSAKSLDRPISMRMIETLEATADYRPETYFQKIDSVGKPYLVRGRREGNEFLIEAESSGQIIKKRKFVLGDLTFPQLASQFILTDQFAVGKEWTFNVINPVDFLPIRVLIRVDRKVAEMHRGELKDAYQVTARMGAIDVISYVDPSMSDPYRIEWPQMGLEYVLEDQSAAELISKEEPADLDVAYFASVVPATGSMPPGEVRRLRVRLSGTAFEGLNLAGDFQKIVSAAADSVVLEIGLPDLMAIEDRRSDHAEISMEGSGVTPQIRRVAQSLKRPTPLTFSWAAIQWMQANIRQIPTSIVPSAGEVMELRQGDCNEFSALYHAFSSAAQFPCKIVSGVVYDKGKFFYHSWNEVLAGGKWVPVDPIFPELPASPKHIKLIEGDFSATWRLAGCLRTLRIDILSAD